MKKILIFLLAVAVIIGCFYLYQKTFHKEDKIVSTQKVDSSEELFQAKTEFIGDNSAVSNLLNKTNINTLGQYTIELKTEAEPYGLIIKVKDPIDMETLPINLENEAAKVIALVKNLDYIIYDDEKIFKNYNHKDLSEKYGFDIKEAYDDKGKLEKIINFQDSNN